MFAVDSMIEIVALELAVTDPTTDLLLFLAPPANGGVNAKVNVVATHFYPTCNQQDVDATLFNRVLSMIQYINYVYFDPRGTSRFWCFSALRVTYTTTE